MINTKMLTKMGSKSNKGIFVAALPASLNKVITNWMRFRKKITAPIKKTVKMVARIENIKNMSC